MALAHAIMSLLVDSPQSGYDLTKKFDGSVGYFWKATHQQIYKDLAKLETQGWIDAEVIAQEGRPDKKCYSVTQLGRQQLIDWIAQPTEPMVIREELLVKTSVSYLVPIPVTVAELKRHHQLHTARLALYHDMEQQYFQNIRERSPEWQSRYLTLRRGIRYEQDYIGWCDEAIQFLTECASSSASPAPGQPPAHQC